MSKCVECGKNLGFLKGFSHPTLGKNNYLCSSCFDTVFESVEEYKSFISPYIGFLKVEASNNSNRLNITDISEQFTHTMHMHDRI